MLGSQFGPSYTSLLIVFFLRRWIDVEIGGMLWLRKGRGVGKLPPVQESLRGPVSAGLRVLVSPDSMLNSKAPACVRCNILADCYGTAMLQKNIVVQWSALLGLHVVHSVVCYVARRVGCVRRARRTESVPIANSGGQAESRVARFCVTK